ncbi:MAG: hypothetical protein ACSLFQ_16875 [Thermoanaerobaculia bacterium]
MLPELRKLFLAEFKRLASPEGFRTLVSRSLAYRRSGDSLWVFGFRFLTNSNGYLVVTTAAVRHEPIEALVESALRSDCIDRWDTTIGAELGTICGTTPPPEYPLNGSTDPYRVARQTFHDLQSIGLEFWRTHSSLAEIEAVFRRPDINPLCPWPPPRFERHLAALVLLRSPDFEEIATRYRESMAKYYKTGLEQFDRVLAKLRQVNQGA